MEFSPLSHYQGKPFGRERMKTLAIEINNLTHKSNETALTDEQFKENFEKSFQTLKETVEKLMGSETASDAQADSNRSETPVDADIAKISGEKPSKTRRTASKARQADMDIKQAARLETENKRARSRKKLRSALNRLKRWDRQYYHELYLVYLEGDEFLKKLDDGMEMLGFLDSAKSFDDCVTKAVQETEKDPGNFKREERLEQLRAVENAFHKIAL